MGDFGTLSEAADLPGRRIIYIILSMRTLPITMDLTGKFAAT